MSRSFWLVLLCGYTAIADAAHQIPMTPAQMSHLGVNLVAVAPATGVMSDRVPARVVIPPQQERVVSSPQAGLVAALAVAEGDDVAAGDVVAEIRSPDLLGLQREFLEAAAAARLAAAERARDAALFQEGIIAERRYQETESRAARAEATLDQARQALLLAGMTEDAVGGLARDRRLDSSLRVRAPIAGVVLAQEAVVGQRVDRAAALYRVGSLEPLWLAIRVPVDRIGDLAPGLEVNLPCASATGVVSLVGRNVDPANQTVLVRAEVSGAAGCLRPGQFIQVRMALLGTTPQWRVPANALVRSGAASYVFARAAEGFRAVPVEVVGRDAGLAVVRGELGAGDQVAASGLAAIKALWLGLEAE